MLTIADVAAITDVVMLTVLNTSIGDITIDAVVEQSHEYPSVITENPVEDGTIYSDHVILMPVSLEIQGRVTDASVTALGLPTFNAKRFNKDDAFRELVRLQQNKQPFKVVTGLEVYENMLLKRLVIPRNAQDGRSLRFMATLQEVQIVGKDVPTNRDNVAEAYRHTALPYRNAGLVSLVTM